MYKKIGTVRVISKDEAKGQKKDGELYITTKEGERIKVCEFYNMKIAFKER